MLGRLPGRGKKKMIDLEIRDISSLHDCYMPFIRNGGLFVAGRKGYELGEEVFILLDLMDEPEKLPIAGRVVWVAGEGVKSPHSFGIGVQFNDPDHAAKGKIETWLAGLSSDRTTATL